MKNSLPIEAQLNSKSIKPFHANSDNKKLAIVITWWLHGNETFASKLANALEFDSSLFDIDLTDTNIYIWSSINQSWLQDQSRTNQNWIDINRNFPIKFWKRNIWIWQIFDKWFGIFDNNKLEEETQDYVDFFDKYMFVKYDDVLLIDLHSAPFIKWPQIRLPGYKNLAKPATLKHQIIKTFENQELIINRYINNWWLKNTISQMYKKYQKNFDSNFPVKFKQPAYAIQWDNIDYLTVKNFIDHQKNFLWICLEVWCSEWLLQNIAKYLNKKTDSKNLFHAISNPPSELQDIVKSEYIWYIKEIIQKRNIYTNELKV